MIFKKLVNAVSECGSFPFYLLAHLAVPSLNECRLGIGKISQTSVCDGGSAELSELLWLKIGLVLISVSTVNVWSIEHRGTDSVTS